MDINKLTAQRIKELRAEAGYSSEDVASEIGISKTAYSQLENGKVEINLSRLDKLAQIFKVPLSSFIPNSNSIIQINRDNSKDNNAFAYVQTQIHNHTDPFLIDSLKSTIDTLQKTIEYLHNK